jgi:hypothetical protein
MYLFLPFLVIVQARNDPNCLIKKNSIFNPTREGGLKMLFIITGNKYNINQVNCVRSFHRRRVCQLFKVCKQTSTAKKEERTVRVTSVSHTIELISGLFGLSLSVSLCLSVCILALQSEWKGHAFE